MDSSRKEDEESMEPVIAKFETNEALMNNIPLNSINFVSPQEPFDLTQSSGEEDEELLEQVINKMETNEALMKNKVTEGEKNANLTIEILQEKFGERLSIITLSDYLMLGPNIFMNDALMEFYLNYWHSQQLSNEDGNRTYVFDPFFYTSLAKLFDPAEHSPSSSPSKIRHLRVKGWTKNVDIFKKDFIFIPINENFHWFMAVICFPHLSGKVDMKDESLLVNSPDDHTGRYQLPPVELTNPKRSEADPYVEDLWLFDLNSTQNYQDKHGVDYDTDVATLREKKLPLVKRPCILIFDSLSGGVQRARITATLRDWVDEEYSAKHEGEKKDFSIMKGSLVKVPQQPNNTDCGYFSIHYFKMFFEKPIIDYTFPINHLENWFHTDEVVKNCNKRRELCNIIKARMELQESILPESFKLPDLNFNISCVKTLYNPQQSQSPLTTINSEYSNDQHYGDHNEESDEESIANMDDEDEWNVLQENNEDISTEYKMQCSTHGDYYSNSEPRTVYPNKLKLVCRRKRKIHKSSSIINDYNPQHSQSPMTIINSRYKNDQYGEHNEEGIAKRIKK